MFRQKINPIQMPELPPNLILHRYEGETKTVLLDLKNIISNKNAMNDHPFQFELFWLLLNDTTVNKEKRINFRAQRDLYLINNFDKNDDSKLLFYRNSYLINIKNDDSDVRAEDVSLYYVTSDGLAEEQEIVDEDNRIKTTIANTINEYKAQQREISPLLTLKKQIPDPHFNRFKMAVSQQGQNALNGGYYRVTRANGEEYLVALTHNILVGKSAKLFTFYEPVCVYAGKIYLYQTLGFIQKKSSRINKIDSRINKVDYLQEADNEWFVREEEFNNRTKSYTEQFDRHYKEILRKSHIKHKGLKQIIQQQIDGSINGISYYVMEKKPGQNMIDFVEKIDVPLFDQIKIGGYIVKSYYEQLSQKGWVHGDIKPGNILLNFPEAPVIEYEQAVNPVNFIDMEGVEYKGKKPPIKAEFSTGTKGFIAPEITSGIDRMTPQADIYALGITLLSFLLRRDVSHQENSSLITEAKQDFTSELEEVKMLFNPLEHEEGTKLQSLLIRMLDRDAKKRPIVPEIYSLWKDIVPSLPALPNSRTLFRRGASTGEIPKRYERESSSLQNMDEPEVNPNVTHSDRLSRRIDQLAQENRKVPMSIKMQKNENIEQGALTNSEKLQRSHHRLSVLSPRRLAKAESQSVLTNSDKLPNKRRLGFFSSQRTRDTSQEEIIQFENNNVLSEETVDKRSEMSPLSKSSNDSLENICTILNNHITSTNTLF